MITTLLLAGAYCYVVLNVAFRIESSQRADLIYDIVESIKSHLSQPHSENIAIHVITISKENAMSLTSVLKRADIAAEWLTSDCSASDRQAIIQNGTVEAFQYWHLLNVLVLTIQKSRKSSSWVAVDQLRMLCRVQEGFDQKNN